MSDPEKPSTEAEWLELPELRNLANNLVLTRIERGFSQGRLARGCRLSQAQVSLFEAGRRLPSLDQFVRLARALDVPLQRLLSGADRPGENLKNLAVELRRLGAVDLWVAEAAVPGAARRPEEIIALAVSGNSPDPRVVETLPALLSWNEINPTILRAYGIATKTLYRLAWLAEVSLAIDRQKGFPGGCRRAPLERFLKAVNLPLAIASLDDLGGSAGDRPIPPIWKRWKISYGATIKDFERRAEALAAARKENSEAVRYIAKGGRILISRKNLEKLASAIQKSTRPPAASTDTRQEKKKDAIARIKKAKESIAARNKAAKPSDKLGK